VPLQLQITTGSATPIYRQIIDQICQAIALGALAPGDQVPSVRALAEQLLINPNTVARTYNDLIRDGILEPQKGRGMFVANKRPIYTRTERLRRLQPALNALVNEALYLGFSPEEVRGLLDEKLVRLEVQR
jgi:GntR family transcriptional regulator